MLGIVLSSGGHMFPGDTQFVPFLTIFVPSAVLRDVFSFLTQSNHSRSCVDVSHSCNKHCAIQPCKVCTATPPVQTLVTCLSLIGLFLARPNRYYFHPSAILIHRLAALLTRHNRYHNVYYYSYLSRSCHAYKKSHGVFHISSFTSFISTSNRNPSRDIPPSVTTRL
jgi:hypothetical protein